MMHASDYGNMGLHQMERKMQQNKDNDQKISKSLQSVFSEVLYKSLRDLLLQTSYFMHLCQILKFLLAPLKFQSWVWQKEEGEKRYFQLMLSLNPWQIPMCFSLAMSDSSIFLLAEAPKVILDVAACQSDEAGVHTRKRKITTGKFFFNNMSLTAFCPYLTFLYGTHIFLADQQGHCNFGIW